MAHTGSENNANSTVMRSNSRKECRICPGKKSKYFTIVTVSSTRNPNLAIQFEFPKFYQIVYRFVDLTAIST